MFQNQEGREPQNAAAQAMRDIQALRGANTELRHVENAPPPLTDEEIMAQFERDTGVRINADGAPIGGAPKSVEELRAERAEVEVTEKGHAAPAQPMNFPTLPGRFVGVSPPLPVLSNGVDLDQKIVLFEGDVYEMSDEDYKVIVNVTNNVIARALQAKLNARLEAAGLQPPRPTNGDEAVPEVQGPPVKGGVQPEQDKG